MVTVGAGGPGAAAVERARSASFVDEKGCGDWL